MTTKGRETLTHQKLRIIAQNLDHYFYNNQGVIMGSTAVVSKKVHEEFPEKPGQVAIFRDKDAGQHYLKLEEPQKTVHIDVLHERAEINQYDVANRVRQIVSSYMTVIDRNDDWTWEEKDLAATNLARRIHVYTGMGYGTAVNPDQNAIKGTDDRFVGHVHILARIKPRYYGMVYGIIDEVERSILHQGGQLRRVLKIFHYGDSQNVPSDKNTSIYLPSITNNMPPSLKKQNLFQIVTSLAIKMGSINAASDFLKSLSPMKSLRMGNLHRTNEDLDEIISEMVTANLAKQTLFGFRLTDSGKELEEFLQRNQKELEAQIRKSIRQFKVTPAKYHTLRYSHLKSEEKTMVNRRKVLVPNSQNAWNSEIAVPDTVIQAAKRCFVQHISPIQIKKEDMRVYGKKSYAPVDTCLLVDCSGSMMGERIKAVGYVAEYLLLKSREKVSLVTFQETNAKVAVPFTRSYDDLHRGLSKISPAGLTPLAHGIVKTLDMFKKERPRNPLLILITDGIPNYPLWTTDGVADAIKAAEMIADQKIRFVCIGIDPNQKYLPLLAKAGKGNVYIVDESDRNSLVDIISKERKQYQFGQ